MKLDIEGWTLPEDLLKLLNELYNDKEVNQYTKDRIDLELRRILKGYDVGRHLKHSK